MKARSRFVVGVALGLLGGALIDACVDPPEFEEMEEGRYHACGDVDPPLDDGVLTVHSDGVVLEYTDDGVPVAVYWNVAEMTVE